MAHKKAAGSAKNLRDSNPKYRGLKLGGGQHARAGNIIIRQKGDKYLLGRNVYKGKDFTVHATVDGVVSFRKKRVKKFNGRTYVKTVVEIVTPEEWASSQSTDGSVAEKPTTQKSAPKKSSIPKVVADKKVSDSSEKDDLTKIEGIGPKIETVFNEAGIHTYADLSGAKIGDLRTILADNKLSQHDPKTWKKQATLAKNGKWEDLKKLQEELDGGK